ncbi:hypothetical protein MBLNU13_g00771t2 [Cladosporium sp. NU13]
MDAAGSSQTDSSTSFSSPSKRGVKRLADESNDDALRFTKRFNLLSLGKHVRARHEQGPHLITLTPDPRADGTGNSNYYIPVTPPPPSNGAPIPPHNGIAATVEDDAMNVDDTRHRVYVQNLDAEIAEIEANEPEERLIFLPDIEKHFSRIPEHLLSSPQDAISAAQQQELVLYSVPRSLTVDEGNDSVRKAILDARQRARDKAAEEARQEEMERQYAQDDGEAVETAHGYGSGYDAPMEDDPDAMDIE